MCNWSMPQPIAQLWAERFDRDLGDLFALQNEITERIARALQSQLAIAEAGRPIAHPDALDYILRGRAQLTKPISRETYDEAVRDFETAHALDPQLGRRAGLARGRCWWSGCSTSSAIFRASTCGALDSWRTRRWQRRRTARSRMPQRPRCSRAEGALRGSHSRNTKPRSPSIAAAPLLCPCRLV